MWAWSFQIPQGARGTWTGLMQNEMTFPTQLRAITEFTALYIHRRIWAEGTLVAFPWGPSPYLDITTSRYVVSIFKWANFSLSFLFEIQFHTLNFHTSTSYTRKGNKEQNSSGEGLTQCRWAHSDYFLFSWVLMILEMRRITRCVFSKIQNL